MHKERTIKPMTIPTFDEVMKLTNLISSETAFDPTECRLYYETLCQAIYNHGEFVEVGLQFGRSSSIALQIAKAFGVHYTGIDPFIEPPEAFTAWTGLLLAVKPMNSTLYVGKSGDFNGDHLTASCILIDGDHSEEQVYADADQYIDYLRVGGFLCFHDYQRASLPGVTKAVDRFIADTHYQIRRVALAGTLLVLQKV